MNSFLQMINEEKGNMEQIANQCKFNLKKMPKGFLKLRKNKSGYSIAKVFPYNKKKREIRITDNTDEIYKYLNRDIYMKKLEHAENNIAVLNEVLDQYKPTDIKNLWSIMPERLHKIKKVLDNHNSDTGKVYKDSNGSSTHKSNCLNKDSCKTDENHKFLTQCGIWVRSKNELYICDRFDYYNIKFEYEPEMYFNGRLYQPDFVIHLPDGTRIIWEHFGMMDDIHYCERNARKLHDYFVEGYIIGKRLIATCSTAKGELDTLEINNIIVEEILPYYL